MSKLPPYSQALHPAAESEVVEAWSIITKMNGVQFTPAEHDVAFFILRRLYRLAYQEGECHQIAEEANYPIAAE